MVFNTYDGCLLANDSYLNGSRIQSNRQRQRDCEMDRSSCDSHAGNKVSSDTSADLDDCCNHVSGRALTSTAGLCPGLSESRADFVCARCKFTCLWNIWTA